MKRESKERKLIPIQTLLEAEAALCGAGAGEDELGDRTGLGTGAATGPNETGKTMI